MAPKNLALPTGSLILVTGANGYIGSHVVNSILDLGYRVRGTIREPKPWLDQYFTEKYGAGKYESVVVPSIGDADAFKDCIKGVDGVVHVASDMSFSPDPNVVITKMVEAMQNLLTTAAAEKSVKRFVFTSSSAAALTARQNEEIVVDKDTWNDWAVQAAWDENTPEAIKGPVVYCACKTEVERTAWKFVEEKKPDFVFNSVLPNCNYGRTLHPQMNSSSMGSVRGLLKGETWIMQVLPSQWFIDVEDTGKLHAIALLDPEVKSERIFGFASVYTWTEIIGMLQKLRPNAQLPSTPENEARDISTIIPAKRAEELLQKFYGKGWTSLEDSIAAGLEGYE